MITRPEVDQWLTKLKVAWEDGDAASAVALFSRTERYFERPFNPGTTQTEIEGYWRDIDGLSDIQFHYDIVAVDGDNAVVHWQNSFVTSDGNRGLLDGVFLIKFEDGYCVEFRQWWFAKN